MDIADFLRARLTEDETAQRDGDTSWHDSSCGSVPCRWRSDLGPCDCGIPDRVLADVAAKCRVVDSYAITVRVRDEAAARIEAAGARPEGADLTDWSRATSDLAVLEGIIEGLAALYNAHPDYDAEWSPGS